ncbi:MAG: tRNA dihydrouridine synthase DusB [Candidatus Aenigmarchaeota archaeon]|nr:tRNA dihydrouridine synthase DusB [Candidatus Aenigmarchaeota archaeon]
MIKIGDVRIKGKTVLAPMCAVSTLPYRILCKRHGAALVFSEMIDADVEQYGKYRFKKEFNTAEIERPVVAQIFGSNPKKIAESAEVMADMNADIVDINMGCPSIKLSRNNAGAILLKDQKLIADIISSAASTTSVPVTAKIRLGIDSSKDTVKIAKIIERAGASAITVHGRTMRAKYAGKADWDMIRKVKDAVGIPVIGNGDVFCAQDAKDMLDQTGCDLVMIGRGAIGNPFIFKQCEEYIKSGKIIPDPVAKEKYDAYRTLCDLMDIYKLIKPQLKDYKVNACWFTKGVSGGREARHEIGTCKTKEEVDAVFSRLCE